MSYFNYEFETSIVRHLIGNGKSKVCYTVVFLPEHLVSTLPLNEQSRPRIEGEINDHPFTGAFQPAGDQRYYAMVPKEILKAAELKIGDQVLVRYNFSDPNFVDVPAALATAIKADQNLQSKWDKLTAGKQRGFAYRVSSAKTPKTIQKRILEVSDMVRNDLSYGKGGKIG